MYNSAKLAAGCAPAIWQGSGGRRLRLWPLEQQPRQLGDVGGDPPGLILREVPHIGPSEVGHSGASGEMPRRGTRREVSRTAARGEVARMAGYLDLIRRGLERDNLARKMKRVSQLFRQIRK
jgi:hypothetical protein